MTMRSWKFHLKILLMLIVLCTSLYLISFPQADVKEFFPKFIYECRENGSSNYDNFPHVCFKEPRIFFVETSGESVLTSRQACAVESTARHNPSFQVIVLMMSRHNINYNHHLFFYLRKLPNVELYRLDMETMTYGTPIFGWYRAGRWKKSKWKASHLSDSLRYLLLWKYGGMYLDLDIVTLRSMEHLKNSVVTENWDRVAAGILFFNKGHELMRQSMNDFAANYDPYNFVKNGPGVITHLIRELCDINDVSKVSGANCNIDILPPVAAFPIPYDKWEDYFIPSSVENVAVEFNSSYLIHVWNKYSKSKKLVMGSKSLYEKAIKQHCPFVYSYAQRIGYV